MEPIRMLPHHATGYFEVFYLGWKPEEVLGWFENEQMRQNGVRAINQVFSNPNQLVQIVDTYDEFCRMCPRNHHGKNYDNNPETKCTTFDDDFSDRAFAEILGLEKVLDAEPITAKTFFDLMKPTYQKLLLEPEQDDYGKKLPLRRIFRIKDKSLLYTNQIDLFRHSPTSSSLRSSDLATLNSPGVFSLSLEPRLVRGKGT